MAVALTFSEVIREARAVQPYTGKDGFQLYDYINEVENVVRLAVEGPQKEHVAQILMSKIQGKAAAVVRRLNDRNWENMKVLLTNTFGVKETYLQIKEDADRIQSKSAKEIFEHLQSNLDKLNLKYKLDNNHPFEFTPTNNESSILEKILNKIHRNDTMYLRTIPVTSLEQAYRIDAIGKTVKIERIKEIVKTVGGIIVTGGEVDEIGIILIDIETIIIGMTISGIQQVQFETITKTPPEIGIRELTKWRLADLSNRTFEAIIGAITLNPTGAEIDYNSKTVKFENNTIPFLTNEEIEIKYKDVNLMQPVEKVEIKSEHLNSEEKERLTKLIRKNEDILFKEGDSLTVTGICKEENLQTIHSQEENFNNHIPVKEYIVNKYQQQLFLVENEEPQHQMTSTSRRRTVITSKQLDTPDKVINFLKIRLQPGTVAIYSEVDDHQYVKLQQIILEGFDNTVTKFIK
ncbi:unnamed protein product [Hermetia illucens]|uniref:Uncharacterized protein n=1 Tax=Hermetia illucens TaxID=343691 RepID=A0A7R8UVD4_HERIL|nr:unnamed protein product [Hermetia illucens]